MTTAIEKIINENEGQQANLENYKMQYNPTAIMDKSTKKSQSLTRLQNSRKRESASRKYEAPKEPKLTSEKQQTD